MSLFLFLGLIVSSALQTTVMAMSVPVYNRVMLGLHPVATLDYGSFKGAYAADGRSVSFLGIPFAAPPVGDLRFRPPQPPLVMSAETPFDATVPGNSCMQNPKHTGFTSDSLKMSEDCLNLNIYLPIKRPGVALTKLPVLVFIYGGSFNNGHNNQPFFNGSMFLQAVANDRQAIIVVPNYRVNAFGFLASKDLANEGSLNAGLLDQIAAFKWVRKYITSFGGNPRQVTAWGHSAGGMSIALHLAGNGGSATPDNNLFNRVIIQSSGLTPLLNTFYLGQSEFDKVVAAVGCDTSSTQPPLDCLRTIDAETLFAQSSTLNLVYRPSVDGKYILEQPSKAIAAGRVRRVPAILLGVTDEGTRFPVSMGVNSIDSAAYYRRASSHFLDATEFQTLDTLYPSDASTPPAYIAGVPYGDGLFNCPARQLSQYLVRPGSAVPIYKGRFDIHPTLLPSYEEIYRNVGVFHGSELSFVWNYRPLLDATNHETDISRVLIAAFTDFASGLVPRIHQDPFASDQRSPKWPQYTMKNQNQLVYRTTAPITKEVPTADFITKCDFWDSAFTRASSLLP
ncbi:hypothetical protein BASA50_004559 [Batrachochytrium salamandrivorans]|uniref:Carboxylesterase type B domain-containing protein n=1 Tax=Batrachochytrium salamandrivorans TaxID=1357716 RepID=A0ABQ8FHW7_9FUNG|nr:hypothetical protein BASA62_006734 [Batrachochytrium salamandrivorans]KAH6597207.1 hypothetical protein BASA50_004559 [Batrachochytrium salamandrivorans]KAH6602512.1 hypothetical protein BASA61_001036 [Batrachochytrium salamandrivorans]KAH9277035.1 hypothetical protein BASA83_000553 [Batrachochytrium salamandrivorans]